MDGSTAGRAEGSEWALRSSCALVPGEVTTRAAWSEPRVCAGLSLFSPTLVGAVSVQER